MILLQYPTFSSRGFQRFGPPSASALKTSAWQPQSPGIHQNIGTSAFLLTFQPRFRTISANGFVGTVMMARGPRLPFVLETQLNHFVFFLPQLGRPSGLSRPKAAHLVQVSLRIVLGLVLEL